MTNLAPGDLVEVVNTPPRGYYIDPKSPTKVGHRGVVVSELYIEEMIKLHDVRFPYGTYDVALAILRKISGPPQDDAIPTLTEIVA
jgi:hypothetical protein